MLSNLEQDMGVHKPLYNNGHDGRMESWNHGNVHRRFSWGKTSALGVGSNIAMTKPPDG